jgi:hypothetical protein
LEEKIKILEEINKQGISDYEINCCADEEELMLDFWEPKDLELHNHTAKRCDGYCDNCANEEDEDYNDFYEIYTFSDEKKSVTYMFYKCERCGDITLWIDDM